jgi:hypothetical protein
MLGVETQPDILIMALALARTAPFRRLQSRIGHSTYRLNTILVGLECVATGGGDGGAIAVTWSRPKSTDQARQVANQARIFACASALVLGADVSDSFLRDFATEEWLGFGVETREIATKAKTRPANQGGAYSVAERGEAICKELGLTDIIKLAALDLLAKWRNVVAHSSDDRSEGLSSKRKQTLIGAAAEIHARYSHFDIALAIKNFENRRMPVPKEATSLIAMAVNLARQIDEYAIKRSTATEDNMCSATEHMLRHYFCPSQGYVSKSWGEFSDAWQGSRDRRERVFKKFLANIGIAEVDKAMSAPLPQSYIDEVISLSRDEFAKRFQIERVQTE